VMIHQQTIETSATAIKLGARFIMHSSDARLMQTAMQDHMNQLREIAGATSADGGDHVDVA